MKMNPKTKSLSVVYLSLCLLLIMLLPGCEHERETLQPEPASQSVTPPTTATTGPLPAKDIPREQWPPIPPPTNPPPRDPLKMSDATNKPWYLPGEEIEVQFSWENIAGEPVTVKPFPLALNIRNTENSLIWSSPPGSGEYSLKEGEILKYKITWDQRDNGGHSIEPGYYFLRVECQVTTEKRRTTFSDYGPLKILVQFPQGAIDRTCRVEQTRALQDGSRIIFKDLVLSPLGAKAHAIFFPVDYIGPVSDRERMLFGPATSHAHYSMDNGPLKSTRNAVGNFQKDMVGLEWDLVNPIPKGTKCLTLIIEGIKFRDNTLKEREWPGPFEFRIELE